MTSDKKRIQTIARALGIDRDEIARRKAYLEFSDADARALESIHERLVAARAEFVDHFYDHLRHFDATRALIDDEQRLASLKAKQAAYFDSLTAGTYDWDYVIDRLRVGVTHQQIGLDPKWYLGAYRKYLSELMPAVLGAFDDPQQALEACEALIKVIFLDMELAIDTYIYADRREITDLKDYAERIICSTPSGLLILSDQLEVVSANEPFGNLFGVRHDKLAGQPLEAVVPLPVLRARASEVLATGVPQYDIPARLTDHGGERVLQASIVEFPSEKGFKHHGLKPRLMLVVDDLTEKEHLRARSQESEARLRTILENVADGVITIDERGTVFSYSRSAETIFGYRPHEVIGQNVKMLMPEPYHSEHDGYLRHYVETGQPGCLGLGMRELVGRHKDGSVFPMELSVNQTQMGSQRVFVGVVRDITERKQAEMEAKKLSGAIEQTADAVLITDNTGTIEYVNPGFEQITGYSAAEVVGGRPSVVKSGLHDEAFYRRLWETLLGGEVFREVFVNRRKDGSLYYEEKSITPIRDTDGEITHFVSSGKDITERMRDQERLHHLAHHDVLTDLPNRGLFLDRLRYAMAHARRRGTQAAVLFLDLDRFKVINDTLGHDVGDRLLQDLGRRLRDCVREDDTVARFGGDECAILLEDLASADDVAHIATKILQRVAVPFTIGERELFVTTSIGISLFPADGDDPNTLLKHADVAMYRAKDRGRNNYQFFTTDMNERAHERLALETDLRRALERDEFLLHYQPQVDLGSGRVIGVEALLRWQHPRLGLLPPLEFIPLLEETGLINKVGLWVLRTAGAQARHWHAAGHADLRVAVNLSAHQLMQHDLVDSFKGVFREAGVNGSIHALELEITESMLMGNVDTTASRLHELNALGVQLSIDDFGTGYSSLAYLKKFPIHTLKIDRSFVRDITTDPDDASIVSAVIAMAHQLKMKVIAEGVETEEQLAFLRQYGCDAVQGYLFSRPAPVEAIGELLQRPMQ